METEQKREQLVFKSFCNKVKMHLSLTNFLPSGGFQWILRSFVDFRYYNLNVVLALLDKSMKP